MSHYCEVEVKFKNWDILVKSLAKLGYTDIEVHKIPTNLYGYLGDIRDDKANIIIRRKYIGSLSNDVGFLYDEKKKEFKAIISEYDIKYWGNKLKELKTTYAEEVINVLSKKKGYKITKIEKMPGGKKICLKI